MLRSQKKLTTKEMKKDPLVILSAKVLDYINKEWMKIGSIILGVVVIVSTAFFIVRGRERAEITAYDIALNAYNNNAPEAIDLMSKYTSKYSGSKRAAGIIIELGNYHFKRKEYDSAEQYFLEYTKQFSGDSIYGLNAYNGVGGIYEIKGDYSKAGTIYEEYIAKYKNSVFIPMMYMNAGRAYYLAGEKENALRNFRYIIERFGDSREKQEAEFYIEMLAS